MVVVTGAVRELYARLRDYMADERLKRGDCISYEAEIKRSTGREEYFVSQCDKLAWS